MDDNVEMMGGGEICSFNANAFNSRELKRILYNSMIMLNKLRDRRVIKVCAQQSLGQIIVFV